MSMDLFKKIDELNEYYIKIWENVCNIESPTNYKEGVDAVGDFFAKMAIQRGWKVEYFNQPVSGNVVCITMNPDANAAPISLSGHIDTVHPVGSFGNLPVRFDKEKIYGPGVTDCKGGIVAAFLAMDALHECGFKLRPIQLLLQSDEEVSSILSNKATIQYICEKAKNSIAFLNMEPHSKGEACLQRKGIITFLFKITGIEAHASDCAKAGANAIAEAAHKILEIEKIKDENGITCCCSIINGGTTANTVPGHCEFKVNVRFATKEQHTWIKEYMQKIADEVFIPGCTTTLHRASERVAMELTEKNLNLLNLMNRSFKANGLPILNKSNRRGGSDAADVTAYGIPCVDSLGVRGGGIHTKDEFAYIDSLADSAKRIVSFVDYISKNSN